MGRERQLKWREYRRRDRERGTDEYKEKIRESERREGYM